jgi:hypothetical protein
LTVQRIQERERTIREIRKEVDLKRSNEAELAKKMLIDTYKTNLELYEKNLAAKYAEQNRVRREKSKRYHTIIEQDNAKIASAIQELIEITIDFEKREDLFY